MYNVSRAKQYIQRGNSIAVILQLKKFSKQDQEALLEVGLESQEPWLVISCLQMLGRQLSESMSEEISRYKKLIELAGIQGDYSLCRHLIRLLPTVHQQDPVVFYPMNLEKTDDGPSVRFWTWSKHLVYRSMHEQYVRKLFALLQYEDFNYQHHIEMLGEWRAGIECYCEADSNMRNAERFGVLRSSRSETMRRPYERYFERANQGIYPIKATINQQELELTDVLRSVSYGEQESVNSYAWIHSDPRTFQVIFPHIEEKIKCFQAMCRESYQTDEAWKKSVIKDIAEIHWWFAQASPYARGSASAAKNLAEALFRLASLKVVGWSLEPDCEALITPTIQEYQEKYEDFISDFSPWNGNGLLSHPDFCSVDVEIAFWPPLLIKFYREKKCTEQEAQAVMRDVLFLSPSERGEAYGLSNLYLTDAESIVLALGFLCAEDILKLKNSARYYPIFSLDQAIELMSTRLITLEQAEILVNKNIIHYLFSPRVKENLKSQKLTYEAILSVERRYSSQAESIAYFFSCVCQQAIAEEGDYITKHVVLRESALSSWQLPVFSQLEKAKIPSFKFYIFIAAYSKEEGQQIIDSLSGFELYKLNFLAEFLKIFFDGGKSASYLTPELLADLLVDDEIRSFDELKQLQAEVNKCNKNEISAEQSEKFYELTLDCSQESLKQRFQSGALVSSVKRDLEFRFNTFQVLDVLAMFKSNVHRVPSDVESSLVNFLRQNPTVEQAMTDNFLPLNTILLSKKKILGDYLCEKAGYGLIFHNYKHQKDVIDFLILVLSKNEQVEENIFLHELDAIAKKMGRSGTMQAFVDQYKAQSKVIQSAPELNSQKEKSGLGGRVAFYSKNSQEADVYEAFKKPCNGRRLVIK